MDELWRPDPARAAATQLASFAALARDRFGVGDGYAALHAWSIDAPAEFWPLLWDYLQIIGERGDRVVDPGASFADARFFPDARLSFAENLLRPPGDDAIALVAHGPAGGRRAVTRRALIARV